MMLKTSTIVVFLTLTFLIGLTSNVTSKDLSSSSLRLQLTEDEIEVRKQKTSETHNLRQIDPEGTKQISYEEWVTQQGTPRPFSSKQVITSSPLRADSKICVIVNSTLYPSIEIAVTQYVADLVLEGYSVDVHTTIGGTPLDLRAFLQGEYALGVNGCLLIGDLPMAWYEATCDWDPPDYEQFPCDYYYMDLDGNFYDTDINGMFDFHDGNMEPEIYIGRLTASPLTLSGDTEANLVNNYFRKNHLYRTGGLITNNRALAFIDDDWEYDGEYINDGLEYIYCQSILFDESAETVAANYLAELAVGYEFVHVSVHSNYVGHYFAAPGGGGSVMNSEIYNLDPPCIFYQLFACSNARYVDPNYMGGWYIFADSYGLAATGTTKTGSMLNFDIYYYPMGNGATIGEAYFIWWDQMITWGITNHDVCWYYGNTLLGDPTLKPRDRQPVELYEAELPYCLKNRNYSFYLDADGGSAPPYYWHIISGQLPDGLTLYDSEGRIAGQPTESGLFNFTIVAEDMCRKLPPNDESVFADTMEYSIGIV
ncbi:MAG: hypothetical protein GY865_14050, partial [candidate division Zixibacteria bacterium]|nr:hypothetical protein [candidate division Zixibacteria bacterium]